jgi:transposase
MKGYSADLRERVVRALQDGKSQGWVAATFAVSLSSVQRWIARYRKNGSVTATVQKRMVGLIREEHYPVLRALVIRLPEAQLPQYCAEWEREMGIVVSTKTMSRMLVRLGLRRKKDHRGDGAG